MCKIFEKNLYLIDLKQSKPNLTQIVEKSEPFLHNIINSILYLNGNFIFPG